MILAIGISGPGPGLAEMGATEYQLMSVMGWTKPDMAHVYIEKENRGKMAASAIHYP